nr:arylsulfatase [Nocardia tengchongensis]
MAPRTRPNIVFMLLDNVGWGDWGCYGGQTPTPRIDALAAEGTRLTNYTVEPQCTPTRSAILTGRLPVRSGTTQVPLLPKPYGLCPWEYTLANLLSDAGYATAAYGKWHLGATEGRLPTDQGFDEWWGLKNTTDEAGYTGYVAYRELLDSGFPLPLAIGMGVGESPKLWEARKGERAEATGELDLEIRPFLDEKIVERATEYIARQAAANQPFFTHIGFTHIHPPERVHPDFDRTASHRLGQYADIIAEIDHRVGQVLDAIDHAGIAEDTIVVLSSDNATGGLVSVPGGSNGPWRGNFFTPPYEGSYRVPAVIRWPGHVPAGRVSNEMVAGLDWLPTFAGILGESDRVPRDRPIDGLDASAFLTSHTEKSPRRYVSLFGLDDQLMSVKVDSAKVVFRYTEGMDKPIVEPYFPMVFDLSSDPHEDFNMVDTKMDCTWILFLAGAVVADYQKSIEQYRNIETGEDFTGY